jgi:cytidine deaminase
MRTRELAPAEQDLIDQAIERYANHPNPGSFSVVAGVLLTDGSTEFGVDVRARKAWVCAEPVVIGQLLTHDRAPISFVVAVCRDGRTGTIEVISPCGSCREILRHHAQHGSVGIRTDDGAVGALAIEDLFPHYGMFP